MPCSKLGKLLSAIFNQEKHGWKGTAAEAQEMLPYQTIESERTGLLKKDYMILRPMRNAV